MIDSSSLIPALLGTGTPEVAARDATAALRETFGLDVDAARFTQDEYSLNSVSGRAVCSDGTTYFFKFHQEEGEQDNVTEYYRAQLLSDAGLPVEVPVAVVSTPGAQMVLYRLRTRAPDGRRLRRPRARSTGPRRRWARAARQPGGPWTPASGRSS